MRPWARSVLFKQHLELKTIVNNTSVDECHLPRLTVAISNVSVFGSFEHWYITSNSSADKEAEVVTEVGTRLV